VDQKVTELKETEALHSSLGGVDERKTKVVAKLVKRKLRGKKTKVNYNEEPSDEDIDYPDVAAEDEPNYEEDDGSDTSEEEGPPAKAPRRSSRPIRTSGLPKAPGARTPGLPKAPGARTPGPAMPIKCGKPGCAYMAARRRDLEDHMRVEHGAPKLVCQETNCTKEFGSYSGLRFHKRAEHQGGLKCSRPGCDYTAAEEQQLSDHGRAKHGAPKLECTEADCTKEFGSAMGLRRHNRSEHQGGLECSSPGCDYTAAEEQQLCDHGRAKHGAPKLECPEADCDLKFGSFSGLNMHKRTIHKGLVIKCPKPGCQYKARQSRSVRDHRRARHGYTKLVCKEPGCGEEFNPRSDLSRHRKEQMG